MNKDDIVCNGEVNFLTEYELGYFQIIEEIRKEFDFICFCQALTRQYGLQAKQKLDHYIALSMRKLLFDNKNPLLLKRCPKFKMPPLEGNLFECPGENNEIMLKVINTHVHIKKSRRNGFLSLNGRKKRLHGLRRQKRMYQSVYQRITIK